MIVEDQLDRRRSRIGRIEKLQEFNELAGAVAFLDEAMDLPRHEIDPGKQAQRSVALRRRPRIIESFFDRPGGRDSMMAGKPISYRRD